MPNKRKRKNIKRDDDDDAPLFTEDDEDEEVEDPFLTDGSSDEYVPIQTDEDMSDYIDDD